MNNSRLFFERKAPPAGARSLARLLSLPSARLPGSVRLTDGLGCLTVAGRSTSLPSSGSTALPGQFVSGSHSRSMIPPKAPQLKE